MLRKYQSLLGMLTIVGLLMITCAGDDNPQSSGINIPNYDPDTGEGEEENMDPPPDSTNEIKYRWDVPGGGAEVVFGCLGQDCIPSLQDPQLVPLKDAAYLQDDDLVVGLIYEGEVIAYPYRILDWHEIVNQQIGGDRIAITYCPLTGSAVAFNLTRTAENFSTPDLRTFGVSGLLYNNNLIPYDRGTSSNWSQMYLRSVNGPLRGKPLVTVPLIETSWATWKEMFPESQVLSVNTGFDRPYDIFPYGNYKVDPFLLFPITIDDTRLPRKQRLHGILTDRLFPAARRTYPFTLFSEGARAINDVVDGVPVVVAGMQSADLYISYSRVTADGTTLTFDVKTESSDIYPFDLVDQEGTVWNLLGEAISGPRKGEKLTPTRSYNAYWFAWGAFFPDVPIYRD